MINIITELCRTDINNGSYLIAEFRDVNLVSFCNIGLSITQPQIARLEVILSSAFEKEVSLKYVLKHSQAKVTKCT